MTPNSGVSDHPGVEPVPECGVHGVVYRAGLQNPQVPQELQRGEVHRGHPLPVVCGVGSVLPRLLPHHLQGGILQGDPHVFHMFGTGVHHPVGGVHAEGPHVGVWGSQRETTVRCVTTRMEPE